MINYGGFSCFVPVVYDNRGSSLVLLMDDDWFEVSTGTSVAAGIADTGEKGRENTDCAEDTDDDVDDRVDVYIANDLGDWRR